MTDVEINDLITTRIEFLTTEVWDELHNASRQMLDALNRIHVLEQTLLKHINARVL